MARLILQTIRYFWRHNLHLALGVAVSTAVITGALIVGDSMRYSLQHIAALRLGRITHIVSAGERYFTDSLSARLEAVIQLPCAPLLHLEGSAAIPGGQSRLPRVQILGIDDHFQRVAGGRKLKQPVNPHEAYISQNLAERLDLREKDELLLRMKKLSVIPLNAPFVSDAGNITTATVTVAGILTDEEMGRFQLQHIQSAPFNVFLSLDFLQAVMESSGKANRLLIAAPDGLSKTSIESALARSWNPADINLKIRRNDLTNTWELTSERLFIDPSIQHALEEDAAPINFVLTYFVNRIYGQNLETPYSFVSTLPPGELLPGEMIINEWLAEDLQAKAGDTLTLDYFVIGPLRELEERSASFVVKKIVPMTGKWTDQSLMPLIPGLYDVGNCRDWETGVPIDLEKVRKKDEDYWDQYRGVPKAYISEMDARMLWKNRFGASTLARFPAPAVSQTDVETILRKRIDPFQLGFQVAAVQDEARSAAGGGVDFTQLFLGLSFFLVLAGLLLTVLFFTLNTERRMGQIGTLSVLGFTNRQLKSILLSENLVVVAMGASLGLFLAIGYNQAVFKALNTIWSPAVRTQTLLTVVHPITLLAGFVISWIISLLAIYFSLTRLLRQSSHALQSGVLPTQKVWIAKLKYGGSYLSGIAALTLVIWSYAHSEFRNAGLFFAAGALLLLSLLLYLQIRLPRRSDRPASIEITTALLIRQNISRNYNRSFLVVALFAIGTFIIVSVGANRIDVFTTAQAKDSGTGGFLFFAASTAPVLHNLNDPAVRFEMGLTGDYPVVPLQTYQGDDASCLNLNRTRHPGIWGIKPEALSGRFRFVSRTEELDGEQPWLSLKKPLGENTIPAIADQTVIQWGLGLKVGDTLQYLDENGRQLGLKLVGGLANSIFQGNVLIDETLFSAHFPTSTGARVFLIDGDPAAAALIREELELSFRDHGWEMQTAAERLAAFYQVENTYLSIFLILGGLGLVIGTVGLGIVLARNLLTRRPELALMLALGFQKPFLLKILTLEHFILLLLGVGIGILSATLASLPAWLNPHLDLSPWNILLLTGLIFLTGICWIALSTGWFLEQKGMTEALREE